MSVFVLRRTQFLPISQEEAWTFFSDPRQLKVITPPEMGFDMLPGYNPDKMYPGLIIRYIVRPLLGIPMHWTTEITHVVEGQFFVDEQREGPYSLWHHQHLFKTVPGGVEMEDIVHYEIPGGIFTAWLNPILIKPRLEHIFGFRKKVLEARYGKTA
jgi:ligand-binding SRPBCC domain-containing protein